MTVTIRDKNDSIMYTFPPKTGFYGGFAVMNEDVSQRMNVTEKLYSHGGVIMGDGKVRSRQLELQGVMQPSSGDEIAKLDEELDLMKYHITVMDRNEDGQRRLYLPQYQTKKFYQLGGMSEMTVERLSSVGAKININWIITDPFLYARNSDLLTYAKNLTIPAGGSYVREYQTLSPDAIGGSNTYPTCPYEVKVEVTSGNISEFYIRNTEKWKAIKFVNEMVTGANDTVTMDFTKGTAIGKGGIWGTGTDVIGYITSGNWWSIYPEGLSLEYYAKGSAGAKLTVTIKWRPRWL